MSDPSTSSQPPYAPLGGYGAMPGPGAPSPYGGYGAPVWQGPQETEGKAIVALVCAIGSFVVVPLIPAVAALIVAGRAQRAIDTSGGRLTGSGLVTAARVTAWINIGLSLVALVLLVLAVVAFGVLGVASRT